jgi:hypothetical protein
MFLNKDPKGGDYNRGFGADANFRFFRDLTVNVAGAKSATPQQRVPGSGDDWYSKSAFGYRGNVIETRAMYQTIGARFNDEMGFVPRIGVDNFEGYFGTHLRVKKFSGWATAAAWNRATWTGIGRSPSRTAPSSRSAPTRTSK